MGPVRAWVLILLAAAVAATGAALIATSSPARPNQAVRAVGTSAAGRLPPGVLKISLGGDQPGVPAVQPGFVGLSLEYPALEPYVGQDPAALDPVFLHLAGNLAPGQTPVLRIGGDSSDWAWWPVPGMAKPGGVRVTLDPRFASVTSAVAAALHAQLILGIDLEADNRELAVKEASELVNRVGRPNVQALELGNEPELYGSFAWYVASDGRRVTGRPPGYSPGDFDRDFRRIGAALPHLPLAGPATGAPKWMATLPGFLRAAPRLGVITMHRYPLQQCYIPTWHPWYPTLAHLFAPAASRGLADSVAPYVRLAHAHRLGFRVDEMSTISCGQGAIAHSFASALWMLDALFQMARVGADGVNIHSYPGAPYALFDFKRSGARWTARVYPQYYGMLMFTRAAPPGSRLLHVNGAHPASLHVWATRAPDGTRHVVLINQDGAQAREVGLSADGQTRPGSVELLRAPNLDSQSGVSLGGRSFGASTATGTLGTAKEDPVTPRGGRYVIRVPPGSALLLTVAG